MELSQGEKHIITANIWATRKEHSKQVLLVTFPSKVDTTIGDAKVSIHDVANESATSVLPVDNLSGLIMRYVQFTNRVAQHEGNEIPPVVTYECRDFDF
jgi:hypothetical protein